MQRCFCLARYSHGLSFIFLLSTSLLLSSTLSCQQTTTTLSVLEAQNNRSIAFSSLQSGSCNILHALISIILMVMADLLLSASKTITDTFPSPPVLYLILTHQTLPSLFSSLNGVSSQPLLLLVLSCTVARSTRQQTLSLTPTLP